MSDHSNNLSSNPFATFSVGDGVSDHCITRVLAALSVDRVEQKLSMIDTFDQLQMLQPKLPRKMRMRRQQLSSLWKYGSVSRVRRRGTSLQHSIRRRVATVFLFAILIVIAFRYTPAYNVYRRFQYWGDAEATVEDIRRLVFQVDSINQSSIRAKLATDEFSHLRALEVKLPLHSDELIWFRANEMFTVGLESSGRVLWMTDGRRSSE